MSLFKRFIISLLLLALTVFFLWAIFVPKGDLTKKIAETLRQQRRRADLFFRGVTFAEIVGGVKYWEIKAEESDLNKTTKIANMKTVDGTFFKKGKRSLKILAPTAKWNMKGNEIYLVDPLGYDAKYEREFKRKIRKLELEKSNTSKFIIPNSYELTKEIGYWFKAKNLTWKLATQRVVCKKGIQLIKGDTTVYSDNLEADVGLERVILTGNPKAVIDKEEKIILTSTKFEVDSKSDIIYALGNVKFVLESTVESNGNITSNAASYNQRNEIIELTGNVEIHYGDISAAGDLATYSLPQNLISLTESPRAFRGGEEIRGEKINIYLDEDRIEVEGGTKIFIPKSSIDEEG